MNRESKAVIAIILFCVLIGSAYIVWPLARPYFEGDNTENRELSGPPVLSAETIGDFPRQAEDYLNDHLPFRSLMIEKNSIIDYFLLKTSPSDAVEIGEDGWLFYKGEQSMDYYTGRKLFTEKELQKIAENMELCRKNLDAKGIRFVLFIAPDRERVYSEFMPSFYGAPAEQCALKQVQDYLRENTKVTVVCPYDELMAYKKKNPDQILYHKTDTHWNDLGAYIGTCALFEAMNVKWDYDSVMIEKTEDTPGDLADMLNLGQVIEAGEAYSLSGFQKEDTVNVDALDFYGHWKYESPSAENGKILVCRDSFCTAMKQYIAEAFRESDMVHYNSFSNDLIEQNKPDYYVFEICERNMNKLLSYTYKE